MDNVVNVPMSRVADRLTCEVKITGHTRFMVRFNVALWLIRLAARIMPFDVKVEVENG